jgi:hypothetical protein
MLSPYHPMQLALGLTVWIAWFILKYGVLAFICELAPPPVEQGPLTWINAALLIGTLIITCLLLYWANVCWRAARAGIGQDGPSSFFIARLGAGINLLGAIVTLCQGLIALLLPPCL